MNGCFWKMVHYFQHKFYNLPQKKGCRKAVFFLMKYEKFIHIENINDFSKKEELYKMHEIIKKNSVPY